MSGGLDLVKQLCPGRQNWRIKVRVIRLWDMAPIDQPSLPFSIDMVLMDSEGNRIQATVRKPMIQKFRGVMMEGQTYRIAYFGIINNTGLFRAARHAYKLLFHSRTRVIPCETMSVPLYSLALSDSQEVYETGGKSDHLVDVMGLLTAVSAERLSARDGRTTRLIVMELSDEKGKVRCTVFRPYVDMIKEYLSRGVDEMPVVIAQFVRVNTYKGDVVLQNVMNTTRVLWNPDIPEAIDFKSCMVALGVDPSSSIGVIGEAQGELSMQEEFTKLFPRKSINELHSTEEEGVFIVLASISAVLFQDMWWYNACRCMKTVSDVDDKYKLKVEVFDGVDTATFILFDADAEKLLGKPCSVLVADVVDPKAAEYPGDFNVVVGMELLFKVSKLADHAFSFDDTFRVKKVCNDPGIISLVKKTYPATTRGYCDVSGRVCLCGKASIVRTSWTERNHGRRFLQCRDRMNNGIHGCKYFDWVDSPLDRLDAIGESHHTTTVDDRIARIERQLRATDEKINVAEQSMAEFMRRERSRLSFCWIMWAIMCSVRLWSKCVAHHGLDHRMMCNFPGINPLNPRASAVSRRKFFAVFRPRESHIRIPRWFHEIWRNHLEDLVVCKDPSGNRFPVYLCFRRGRLYFCLGVQNIRDAYGISTSMVISFTLVNSRYFCIRVFGSDANEITYPALGA
ncbi:Zinc finger, GRF-type [Sesbania bispinosa]|nr:Zinc finger, GRF-type [Sesbania bispinosa]